MTTISGGITFEASPQRPISTIAERSPSAEEAQRKINDSLKREIKKAEPAIVVSFDPVKQTIVAAPSIRERFTDPLTGAQSWVEQPLILDVPVQFPRGGNYIFTFPLQPGDEVLLVYADLCIDSWWANGGIQNWNDRRRHDRSDAIAIPGVYSQPNALPDFNATGPEWRQINGTSKFSMGKMTLISDGIPIQWDQSKQEANGASVTCTMTNTVEIIGGVPVEVPTPTIVFVGKIVGI